MSLFSRAFEGVPAEFASPLDASAALARLLALKRWAPGKPLLTGEVGLERIALAFATGSGYGRAWTRFEGRLESSDAGCVLRGRFVNGAPVRVFAALFIVFCGLIAFGGLASGLDMLLHGVDSLADFARRALGLVGWLLGLGLFGGLVLWNAGPSHYEMRDMKRHLTAALQADASPSV